MSVASLNLYHHGKHHFHRVPPWLSWIFLNFLPKILFMDAEIRSDLETRQTKTRRNSQKQKQIRSEPNQNGKMVLYDDRAEEKLNETNRNDILFSTPLILRSSSPTTNSNSINNQISTKRINERENSTNCIKISQQQQIQFSIDYLHKLIEQNERRHQEQEVQNLVVQEWQILSRVVDRLFVFIFSIASIFVFCLIFARAPHIRWK